jgi:hypothetical protein
VRKLACTIATVALLVLATPSASAGIVTIGPPLDQAQPAKGGFGKEPVLVANASLSPISNLSSPVSGTVIRWRLNQTVGGPFRLRVLRPNGGLVYTTVGTSDPVSSPSPELQTFPAAVRIQAGDTIALEALEPADDQGGFVFNLPSFSFIVWKPPPPDGIPTEGQTIDEEEAVALNADVHPTPTVTSVTPGSGNIRGGTKVKLAGTDFIGVSELSFGGKTVTSFTVDSENQISLTTPGVSKPGPAAITITTPGGTSPPASPFTYKACKVPKLKDKTLGQARKRLRKANCRLGKVKHAETAGQGSGRVVKQRPPSGLFKPPGTRVRVTLG